MTSLYKQLNPPRPIPQNIRDMIFKFRGLSNPQAVAEKYIQDNPQLNSMIQAANGSPETAFRNLAKQMNIDADEFIKMFQ